SGAVARSDGAQGPPQGGAPGRAADEGRRLFRPYGRLAAVRGARSCRRGWIDNNVGSSQAVIRAGASQIVAVFTFAGLSLAQNAPAFRSKTELVVVSCAVVNANGVFVEGLSRDQFQVNDNGARRIIEHFAMDVDLPLTIGILIDVSESQKDQFEEH